jgi:DNA end-binding protein Ku
MAPRALSTGTLSFGLVSIPVKLYSASQPSAAISFNLLHGKDGSRLRQQYLCTRDGEVVERSEMVKGYEISKDRYVIFTAEELKSLEEKASEVIEIAEFVPEAKVDPVYYDKPYYLSPDRGGEKAYRLLSEVMRRTGRVALARYAARGKQYLAMLRPKEGGLVMQQLLYADEVRPFSEVPKPVAGTEVKEGEFALAEQLVAQIATDEFHPEKYHDDVKDRILEAIHRKAEGQTVEAAAPETQRGQIIDLMEALKQSLAQKEGTTANEGKARYAEGNGKTETRKPPRSAPRASGSSGASEKREKSRASKK